MSETLKKKTFRNAVQTKMSAVVTASSKPSLLQIDNAKVLIYQHHKTNTGVFHREIKKIESPNLQLVSSVKSPQSLKPSQRSRWTL